METKYLIIGGGPAGTSAAEAIRSVDQDAGLTIVDDQGERLYSKIVLHKFIERSLEKASLYLKDASWYKENNINLVKDVAITLDSQRRAVGLKSGGEIEYQKLLFAGGGSPRKLGVQGENLPGVYNFYSLKNAQDIARGLESARRVAVIGGGFLTIDILQSLTELGKKVTVIVRTERILQEKVGPKGSEIIKEALERMGVELRFNSTVQNFSGGGKLNKLMLSDGELEADMAIVAIGVISNTDLAKEAGASVERGIIVDESQKTSLPDIFAAGDLCQIKEKITGESFVPGNWYFALVSGKVAGLNMAGREEKNTEGPLVTKVVSNLKLGFIGFINQDYAGFEFEKDGRCLQVFVKDDIVVGLSLVNLGCPVAELKSLLYKKFNKSEAMGLVTG